MPGFNVVPLAWIVSHAGINVARLNLTALNKGYICCLENRCSCGQVSVSLINFFEVNRLLQQAAMGKPR